MRFRSIYLFLLICLISFHSNASISNDKFIERVQTSTPNDVMNYWEYYSSIQDIREVNSAYVKIGELLPTKRLKIINDIAYVKCVVELSVLDKSFELLRKLKPQIEGEDWYIKGCYHLVFARLLNRLNRYEEAIKSNQKAIFYLKKTVHTDELKHAYLNLGYFYSKTNNPLEMENYELARKLEKEGETKFYALLRTNLALHYLLRNDTKKAIHYCDEAQKLVMKSNKSQYLDQFRIFIILASIYEAKGILNKEIYYLKKAKDLCIEYGMNMNLMNVIYSESYNAVQINDYKGAYCLLKERDSLSQVIGLNQISENLAVYDLEDKIAIAKKDKKKIANRLKLKRKQQQLLLVVLVIILLILFIITTLFFIIRKKNEVLLAQNLALAKAEVNRTKPESANKNINIELIIELEKLIFDKELYKNSGLTIDKLAKKLNTNRTYLSEAINTNYETNYSSWINEVRINAARKMLASQDFDHFSIDGISKTVGYVSISSFNSSFKKINGLTPSQFKNMRVESDRSNKMN